MSKLKTGIEIGRSAEISGKQGDNHVLPGIELVLAETQKDFFAFFQIALSLNNSGIIIYDIVENKIFVNSELSNLLKVSFNAENIYETLFNKITIADDETFSFINTLKLISDLNPADDFEFKLSDEKENRGVLTFYCKMQLTKIDKKEFVVVVFTDISDVKKIEEEVFKARAEAEESERVKNVFLSNLSHEIRTPMNAILGFTELLNIGEVSSEKRKEFLSIIKLKSKYLLSLIDDIAELAKFESGTLNVNKSETNIARVLNELYHHYIKERQKLNKQHLEIYLNLPADTSLSVIYTDPGRLQQVMTYLLDNAIRFTEKGYIQFGFEQKDTRNLLFYVKDTGIGIPKDVQKYLFSRFKNQDEILDKKYSNTGLGLTISKTIVELLGGKIHVDSVPGQGTTFSFTLPFQKTVKTEVKEKSEIGITSPNWRNKVILVAEDDDVNYVFLEALFSNTHAQLIHVNNGFEAVKLCKTINKIDLVLMDIKMPEMNGFDAVREIKNIRKDIPIIAQTAYTLKEEKAKCIEAGCDDYISKPIDIELLIKKINKFFAD